MSWFSGFARSLIFPAASQGGSFSRSISIHPTTTPAKQQHHGKAQSERQERERRESLGKGFVSGNICRSDDSCTRKCSPQRMQRDGSRRLVGDPARLLLPQATGGGTFLTRLLGGPSLNSNPSSHGWCWSCGPAGRASASHRQEGEGEHIINETNTPTDTKPYNWASAPICAV